MGALTENKVIDICFCNSAKKELNNIIEAELQKGEFADLDLIDDCCNALELINADLYNGEECFNSSLSVLGIIRKYNLERNKKILLSASCLVVVGALTSVMLFMKKAPEINKGEILTVKASESVKIEQFETITEKEKNTSTVFGNSTTRLNEVKKLKVMQPLGSGKLVFESREAINLDSFYIYVECVDGKRFSVVPSECQFEILETAEDGATIVKVMYNGFETYINVTVSVEGISEEMKTEPVEITTQTTVDFVETTVDMFLEDEAFFTEINGTEAQEFIE